MRNSLILAFTTLSLFIVACSGVDIQQSGTDKFSAGHYQYYKWRTEPLPGTTRSNDPVYKLDPVIRREVDADLQSKGYILDKKRAQFTVDYLYVSGMQQGERSQLASNVTPYPRVTPNRQVNQATVDNAIALGGVKETNNIILQFNDLSSNLEVWQATLTKVVEDANNIDTSRLDENLKGYLASAMKSLPPAGQ
jgi:hypothetical protein